MRWQITPAMMEIKIVVSISTTEFTSFSVDQWRWEYDSSIISGGMGIKKDMTIPPGYRRVFKNGRLKYTPRILFFQKKTAA